MCRTLSTITRLCWYFVKMSLLYRLLVLSSEIEVFIGITATTKDNILILSDKKLLYAVTRCFQTIWLFWSSVLIQGLSISIAYYLLCCATSKLINFFPRTKYLFMFLPDRSIACFWWWRLGRYCATRRSSLGNKRWGEQWIRYGWLLQQFIIINLSYLFSSFNDSYTSNRKPLLNYAYYILFFTNAFYYLMPYLC